jgi:prepilin-type N-terminal cleavage/methylation domain-containing protein
VIADFGLRILDWETAKARRPMQMTRRTTIQNPKSKIQNGFTLVEMLTVIGIIVLLVSILLPVVSAVRIKGQTADTQAMLARIASGIQSYYADFNAYPGPLGNNQVHMPGSILKVGAGGGGSIDLSKSTMAENLTLGLLGGLVNDQGVVKYNPDLVGQGPLGLNPRNPKKYHAYMDKVSLTTMDPTQGYHFKDDVAEAEDTELAEFVDRYPDPIPILYLRAKPGAPVKTQGSQTIIVTNTATYSDQGPYDLNQVISYTKKNIGVGKDSDVAKEFKPPLSGNLPISHGFKTADPGKTINENPPRQSGDGTTYQYPYDLNAYMRHPSLPNAMKQQDGFLLISAGPDRIYGTKDDLQYPASR